MTVDFGSADIDLSQTLHGEYPLLSSDDAEDRLCPTKGFAPRLSLHPAPGTLRKYNVFCFSLPSTKISLTQKQMSAICNIRERSYQNYEGGDRIPRLDDLIALADFFDVSLDYLVGRSDNPKVNTNVPHTSLL